MSVEETGGTQSPQQGGGLEAIGERLASARRERKLELGAVASQMHLSREVVAALEAGNASALPAMTFVRGYIKTYARLLGLDEKEVFALLPVTEGFRPAPLKAVGMRG
ncbi:MAG: helix-turn-helix domain-containing protein, partial [Thiogranum sp.]